jgi:hypothetical protein
METSRATTSTTNDTIATIELRHNNTQQQEDNTNWFSWNQIQELFAKFNIPNLLFCYCLPFFYVFYPTLLMPAIFLRSLSFFIGWIYKLISAHHHNTELPSSSRNAQTNKGIQKEPPSLVEDEMNNMYFWLQRCSICLDQTYSLCLESCRDQFCKDCFARFVVKYSHRKMQTNGMN